MVPNGGKLCREIALTITCESSLVQVSEDSYESLKLPNQKMKCRGKWSLCKSMVSNLMKKVRIVGVYVV
jgi:hypothetical protein